ncbi:MAG: RsmD family RNA methyltransferase [Marinilabiliaceae bacterium]|nr:RsmD family RNA methyltransferase [Marinilabiliaceae bacterium]
MRITGGTLKGRRFSPPSNFRARPTTDMAKENLFNILTNFIDFSEIKMVDLFSGTGSISFEFASRGCKDICSIENDYQHYKFICKCVEQLQLSEIVKPVKQNVFLFLQKAPKNYFDIIFADPPFELRTISQLPKLILDANILKKDGYLIVEHGPNVDFSKTDKFWQLRHYGKVCFSFFH